MKSRKLNPTIHQPNAKPQSCEKTFPDTTTVFDKDCDSAETCDGASFPTPGLFPNSPPRINRQYEQNCPTLCCNQADSRSSVDMECFHPGRRTDTKVVSDKDKPNILNVEGANSSASPRILGSNRRRDSLLQNTNIELESSVRLISSSGIENTDHDNSEEEVRSSSQENEDDELGFKSIVGNEK
jgi:hypothetical protein